MLLVHFLKRPQVLTLQQTPYFHPVTTFWGRHFCSHYTRGKAKVREIRQSKDYYCAVVKKVSSEAKLPNSNPHYQMNFIMLEFIYCKRWLGAIPIPFSSVLHGTNKIEETWTVVLLSHTPWKSVISPFGLKDKALSSHSTKITNCSICPGLCCYHVKTYVLGSTIRPREIRMAAHPIQAMRILMCNWGSDSSS